MMNLNSRIFCLILFAAGLTCSGCTRDPDDQPADPALAAQESLGARPQSHQKMVAVLQEIAGRSATDHPLIGEGPARELRLKAALMKADADPFAYVFVHSELGQQELRLDNLDAAIRHLELARQKFHLVSHPDPAVRQRFRNRLIFTLGTAYIRLGETQNCCALYTSDSCIVPIRGTGIHDRPAGSLKAIECFLEVLAYPTDDEVERIQVHETARWLLNIACMTIGEYPDGVPEQHRLPAQYFESTVDFPRFRNVYPQLGLDTFNLSGGAVVDDFNGDDLLDIVTSSYDPAAQIQFFRNNGDGSFAETTHQAGLTGITGGLNLIHGDYDNDGDPDLYVCRGAWLGPQGQEPNSLLRNDNGVLTDVTFEVGLGQSFLPCKTAAWADFDNDGDLDLYVGNESSEDFRAASQLFRNDGAQGFTDVSTQSGLDEELFVMGAVWGDYDSDRFPDLFVSAGGENRLYHNNRDGTFSDVAAASGVTHPLASFPAWFWDYNNDGQLDLFVSCSNGPTGILSVYPFGLGDDLSGISSNVRQLQKEVGLELMALYQGNGAGEFENVSADRGLNYPTLPMGANFGDLNNDGYSDFYLGTGDVAYSEIMPNVMFLNQRGAEFVNVTMAGGFGHLQKGHGVSFADIDNDGDQDVYMQMGGAYPSDRFNDALYENPGCDGHWLCVHLIGSRSNRSAIGARIRAVFQENGVERSVYRHVSSGGSFGSNPLRQWLGTGAATQIRRLEVYWPTTDQTQVFENIQADQLIRITEDEAGVETVSVKSFQLP
ncbi:MAG: VCBS repeat-containing protein [Fuerstiella sp.]